MAQNTAPHSGTSSVEALWDASWPQSQGLPIARIACLDKQTRDYNWNQAGERKARAQPAARKGR